MMVSIPSQLGSVTECFWYCMTKKNGIYFMVTQQVQVKHFLNYPFLRSNDDHDYIMFVL